MLNVLIPMAGEGRRFREQGYTIPKPFIDLWGKPMIYRVLENLDSISQEVHFILLARTEHVNAFSEKFEELRKDFNIQVVPVGRLTEGAACTTLYAYDYINSDDPLLILNSDQIIDFPEIYLEALTREDPEVSGRILCFEDNSSKWSYVELNSEGNIVGVKEKQVISPYATAGIYYFSHGKDYIRAATGMIIQNDRVNNEFYVAPTYNYLEGKIEKVDMLKEHMHGTGTPEDLKIYLDLCKNSM